MPIPESFIQEVIERNPLEEVVSLYATVRRAGANQVCCCPFHNEKTPSFTLYSSPPHFYCYGCGAGGDVITFIRRIENLDYVSAIEFLANRAGLPMPQQTGFEKRVDKKRFYDMNAKAARFWHETLLSPAGKAGLDYLVEKRGLSMPVIKRFGLGYAPEGWEALYQHLRKEGYSDKELHEAFLIRQGTGGSYYDAFRGRVMFPVIDASGNVVAFSGRLVAGGGKDDRKYVNTNDTPVYKKSKTLFALNLAKNSPDRELILCEGNVDVVSLHAAGYSNAVASLGTALTGDQCRLLARFTDRVILCYDADDAGKNATQKAIRLLQSVGLKVRVITLTGQTADGRSAKDPDDFLRLFGKGAFEALRQAAPGALEYLFREKRAKFSLSTMDEKDAFVKECLPLLADEGTGEIERELYIGKIAEETALPIAIIRAQTEKEMNRRGRKFEQEKLAEEVKKTQGLGNRVNPDKAKFLPQASKEEGILGILLQRPEALCDAKIRARFKPELFQCAFLRRAAEALLAVSEGPELCTSRLNEFFTPEEIAELEELRRKRERLGNQESVLHELFDRLEEEARAKARREEPLSADWLERLRAEKGKKE